MIIAIAANENNINATVDPHFGRCDWYCLYDTESGKSTFIENPVRYNQEKAGFEAAGFLIGKGISIVIAGRFGSNVMDVLRKNNIQMIIPETQVTLKDIIKQINKKL